jgi:hypothetical protein
MKKLLFLVIILAALIGAAVYKQNDRKSRLTAANRVGAELRELLFPDLDMNSIQKIRVKDGTSETNIAVSGDRWAVTERSGYPASFEKLQRVMNELREQKISGKVALGKNAWGESKLNPPGEGDNAQTGLLVELLDGKGNQVLSFVLGDTVQSSGSNSQSPFGGGSNMRLVRVINDKDTVWTVNNQFYELSTKPEDWLDKASFIDVQKIKEVEVTQVNAADSWKASRKDESSEFTLSDAKSGEELDNGKAALSGLLANPTMTDVLPKDKATADFMKDAVKAKITTLDGFTYNVQVVKKGKDTSDEKHYITAAVSADLPKARTPAKDEKEEDKKKADEKFTADKKAAEEKLAKEKKAEGWIYEVGGYVVTALMKKRSEVLKDAPAPAAPATPAAPTPAGTPSATGDASSPPDTNTPPPVSVTSKPVSVTTPPISVPPVAETKPADAKAAEPAKAEGEAKK